MAAVAQHALAHDQASVYLVGETAVVPVVAEAAVVAAAAAAAADWWVYWVGWSFSFLRDKERFHR